MEVGVNIMQEGVKFEKSSEEENEKLGDNTEQRGNEGEMNIQFHGSSVLAGTKEWVVKQSRIEVTIS